mmetsp:Transcript_19067/g.21239  ORF Transcript_19067/g.21239 Transcript_19067/m.21239 type:complete len:244 (+) Transcript_19067:51-782(+)
MSALRLLQNTYKRMMKEPVEGFCVDLPDESDFFRWVIYLEGPPGTPYEKGVFQLQIEFPDTYPMSPPSLRFMSDFWHPNVYKDGRVCISILHPPGEDSMSGELPEERWMPSQTVETVILSVMSMLNDPNISSPANVDASVEWRKSRDKYIKRVDKLVEKAMKELPSDVKIPHPETNPEEKRALMEKRKLLADSTDFMMDDYDEEDFDMDFDEDDYYNYSDGEGDDGYDDEGDEDEEVNEDDDA